MYYLNDKRFLAYAGTLDFEDLPNLFERYRVSAAAIDLNPETRKVNEYKEKLPQLFSCEFMTGVRPHANEMKVDRRSQRIVVDRTVMCDHVSAEFQTHHILLP